MFVGKCVTKENPKSDLDLGLRVCQNPKLYPNSSYYQSATYDNRPSSANNNQLMHGSQQPHESFVAPAVQGQVQRSDFRNSPVSLGQYGQHSAVVPPARPVPNVWMDNRFNNPS